MHVRRALALSVLAPLLLAGCSDGDPEPSPTPKMPESTSSSPSASESETPEAESAEDFVRRWVQAGDEMQVTGKTDEYSSMAPKCVPCQAFVKNVRDVYDNGGSAEFAGSKLVQLKLEDDAPPTLVLTKDVPKTTIHRADGSTEVLPAGRTTLVVTLGRDSNKNYVVTQFAIRS